MGRFLLLFAFSCFSTLVYGQSGIIRGKVVDAGTGAPIEFATIIVFKDTDSTVVNGGSSNAEGFLLVDNLPLGKYRAKIQFLGYKPASFPDINLTPEKPVFALGQVKLLSESVEVQEVVVQGDRPMMQTSIDKKVFNVSKSLVSEGGSATDVLKQVPSVDVDVDGKISLRGSENVTILIDGKPSSITGGERGASLEHLPGNIIERVEVITNPSAKYNPEGVSGIINIVTKKNRAPGYNGQVNATAGTWNKFNGSAAINYNVGKVNLFGNYAYRHNQMNNSGTSLRRNFYSDTVFYLDQENIGAVSMNSHTLQAGLDYNVNEKNTINFSSVFNSNNRRRFEDIFYNNLDENKYLTQSFSRSNFEPSTGLSFNGNISYKHNFKKQDETLTLSGNYSAGRDMDSLIAGWFNTTKPGERTHSVNYNSLSTIQGDYALPLPKDSKLEAGFMGTFRDIDRDFTAENQDGRFWLYDFDRSNHYVYDENIFAGYATYQNHIKTIGYQLSLRAEETQTKFHQEVDDSTVRRNYFSLFPGLHLSYKLNEKNELQLSYSRRINRPRVHDLNPFIDYSDPFNLRSGNPNLKPEYIDAYELGHIYQDKKMTLGSTLYYRFTHDKLTYIRTIDTSTGITITTSTNAATASAAGLELIANNTWSAWFNTAASVNLFRNELQGSIEGTGYSRSNVTVNGKLTINFQLQKKTSLQLSYNYRGPMLAPQGVLLPMHGMDAGLKMSVLKNMGSLNVTLNDVFNTRKFGIKGTGQGFDVDFVRRRESRILYVGLTCRFGNGKLQPTKQKKQQRPQDNGGDMDETF
jgi:iron complex outermembrane recepter protein